MKLFTIELSDELDDALNKCEQIVMIKKNELIRNVLKQYCARIIQKDLDDVQKILKPRHASVVEGMKEAIKREGESLRKETYAGI